MREIMKRTVAAVMAVLIACAAAGCSSTGNSSSGSSSAGETTTTTAPVVEDMGIVYSRGRRHSSFQHDVYFLLFHGAGCIRADTFACHNYFDGVFFFFSIFVFIHILTIFHRYYR